MPEQQNWRQEIDMLDYLSHQKKATQVADRRPVIRKPSDLVGPGIAQSATVVTDWNNTLATFNGYFSSSRALNAPVPDAGDDDYDSHLYAGFVTMDATYGGKQIITDLETGLDYSRIFRRAPVDPNTIVWGPWVGSNAPDPSAYASSGVNTPVPQNTDTFLKAPTLGGSNITGTYLSNNTSFDILRDGVYSGVIRVMSFIAPMTVDVSITLPKGLTTQTLSYVGVSVGFTANPFLVPFTFVSELDTSAITVKVYKTTAGTDNIQWYGLDITRTSGVV